MIRLEASTGAPPTGWDDTVARLGGHVFHSSLWAAYQEAATGARPVFLLSRDEHGEPAAVSLALFRHSRRPVLSLLMRELVLLAHPATVFTDLEAIRCFVAASEQYAKSLGCARLHIDSFASGPSAFVPSAAGYTESLRLEFVLELKRDLDSLWSSMRKDQRERVRRLEREGVAIDQGSSREDCRSLALARESTQLKRTSEGLGYELRADGHFYDLLYEYLVKTGAARLFLARRGNDVLGALFFAVFRNRAYSMFSGSTEAGYRLGVQSGLFWAAVKHLRDEGMVELNRGGVPASAEQPDDPLHGIYLFKSRLGTTPYLCRSGVKVLSPLRDRLMRVRERRWR